ncbi:MULTISPECIES: sodium/proline symporter [Anaerotruncus]|uniref:sodium/proline symporter n=1 Tax=Anaerotruncus TaxID=244127 RepID=UPI00082A02B6|nr:MULTISPECIES: sodium/proline symporter [Anaerotruncus]RGX55399.1 sodium/proline symporter [Anaerotruncus sp. AF02-27]
MFEKILMIVIFFAVTVSIGVYCNRKAQNVGDFVLGGRNVGPWVTAFAYGTSYFSSVVFVGYAGQFGYNFGVAATWIGIGNALIGSLLAWVVLGRRTRVMTKHFESATMPDFFAKRYQCDALRVVSSVIIFIFLVPYSASVYKGLSGLFAMAFGIDFKWCVIGIAVLTGIYVVVGGYMAAALNDLVQGVIMIGGICVVIAAILNGRGGFTAALEQLSQVPVESAPQLSGALVSFFGPDPLGLLGVVILTSLGTLGLPQMVHKFYTIKNEKSIKAGTIISTVFALIIAGGSYFMGAFGRLYYTLPESGKPVFDNIVPEMLGSCLPDLLIGVVMILVLSASMSTLSSLVITSSSTFTLDFLKHLFMKDMTHKVQLRWIRLLCIFFVVLSVVLALNPNNLITTLMSLSWGALAGSFLGPFIYALFWRGATRASVWACFVTGIGINLWNFFAPFAPPTTAGAIAIVASLFVAPLVSLFTPKLSQAHLDVTFSCYDQTVPAPHKFMLDQVSE